MHLLTKQCGAGCKNENCVELKLAKNTWVAPGAALRIVHYRALDLIKLSLEYKILNALQSHIRKVSIKIINADANECGFLYMVSLYFNLLVFAELLLTCLLYYGGRILKLFFRSEKSVQPSETKVCQSECCSTLTKKKKIRFFLLCALPSWAWAHQ